MTPQFLLTAMSIKHSIQLSGEPEQRFFREIRQCLFGLTLNANGTSKTQSSWDLGGEGTGWAETEYIWERAQNTNTLQLYSCRDAGGGGWQDTDSNGVMDTCPSNDYFALEMLNC